MGCGLSKQEEEDDVVFLCRERKKLLKLALERRYAFADAQCKYNQSLYSVAMALRLFVARHSSSSSSSASPLFITFHDECQRLEETPKNNVNEEEEKSEEEEEVICDHFYDEDGPSGGGPSSQNMEFGWDFFYPFDEINKTEMLNGFDDDEVREKEGIQEVEEEEEEALMGNEVKKELKVIDTMPSNGRELLEALKDIEDHFLRAHNSGLDITRMLEANRVHLHSGLEEIKVEIKETSSKLIRSISWHRSTSFRSSSSSRSLLSSGSTNSSKWTEFKADALFDEFGMEAGSHSLTLGRLYAWEKKLYQEVKAGEETRKVFERKCSRLRKSDTNRDRFSAEVKELHSRISVAIRSVESISNRIEKLTDEELQPQFLELLNGLMTNWKVMLESHETQNRVMLEVKHFNAPAYGKFSNESHRLATLQLEAELDNWRTCFDAYVSTQKSYIEALCGWLSKFIAPEVEFYSGRKSSLPPHRISGPPLLVTCQAWLAWLDKLPDKAVTYAMKSFGKDVHAVWSQQGKEQQQKRKVDGLARELEKRNLAFQRAERKILESNISEQESQANVRNRVEYLTEGKRLLDMFKKRLDEEKEKHISSMHNTQQITVCGFQTGFSSVFGSLAEFSGTSVKMYADLVTYSSNAKTADKNDTDLSYIDMIN